MHLRPLLSATLVVFVGQLSIGAMLSPAANADESTDTPARPNILVIFTDDQGYGDLGCYGSETFRTPRIDQLAEEGTRFTNFYAQVVCGPSRSALLTGRYPVRSLGWSMPAEEITVAERLQESGYVTGCIGKWDVSNRQAIIDRMPVAQGFDYFWGTLGANDNGRVRFHENNELVGETGDMASLTRTYTDKAIGFLKEHKEQPFFLYVAHTMVHSVIDASPEFLGKSAGGLYGDTMEELDHETGRLLDAVDDLGLREQTLVIFTTDNGPWSNHQESLGKRHNGQIAWGSSGPLREAKGSTYEGGLRVPCIARWPGHIPAQRTSDAIFATIDFLPTFGKLAGFEPPDDRIIDGVDQTELLLGQSDRGHRDDYYYFCQGELHAVRRGDWKLVLADRRRHYGYVDDKGSDAVELYNLKADVGETEDQAESRPEVVKDLLNYATTISLPDAPYDNRIGLGRKRSAGANAKAELPSGDWKEHGFTEAQREQIRTAFQRGIEGKFIPGGALLLIHRGEVVLREAFGVADIDSGRPFLVDSPCRIASVTKPHTATMLNILAERGVLSLDEPVDEYLPEFRNLLGPGGKPAASIPTLRHCLSHTAGFASNNELKSGKFAVLLDGRLADVVADLATKRLVAEPGTRYAYSRLGFIVAGRVAEVTTGRPFPELLRRHLLMPIGAADATFSPLPEIEARMPVPYNRTKEGFVPREGDPLGTVLNPGGGLVSTLDNVGRLLLLHRNRGKVGQKQVISAEALQQMYVKQPGSRGNGYGLGFNIMRRRPDDSVSRVRHTGASGTLAVLDFDQDLILIVLTQVPQQQTNKWRDRLVRTIGDVFESE